MGDSIKELFPKADKKTEFVKFFSINMASGGLAGAGSLCIVYPLDYARTRLASDVGGKERQFNGLVDCLKKTVQSGGIGSVYNGIGVSVMGIIPYRGAYFGLFDTLSGYNPYQKSETVLCALLPNLYVLKHLPSQPDMSPAPSTLSVVVYKCNLRNQRVNGYTKVLQTVLER